MRIRPGSSSVQVTRLLLDGQEHTAPELIEGTGISMTTVYGILSRMTVNGWIERDSLPGTSRRSYRATEMGLRAMRYVIDLADQSSDDDSRSSSPTAARNSS
jgi:DNA-binding PadR family transcriptional regulator